MSGGGCTFASILQILSSILIWMDSYFIVRYRPVRKALAPRALWPAVLIGFFATTFLGFHIPLVKGQETPRRLEHKYRQEETATLFSAIGRVANRGFQLLGLPVTCSNQAPSNL